MADNIIQNKTGRIEYIDSLKGIVCFLVFLGHFYYGFYTSASNTPELSSYIVNTRNLLNFFTNRFFTVSIFAFISGYFIKTEYSGKRKLISSCFKRYIRFVFPLFFVFLLIAICRKLLTYDSCKQLAQLLNSDWLLNGTAIDFNFFNVIKSSFVTTLLLGDSSFETPVWVLQPMFIGYIFTSLFWAANGYKYKKFIKILSSVVIILCGFVSVSVLAGSVYKKFNTHRKKSMPLLAQCLIFISCFVIGSFKLYNYIPTFSVYKLEIKCSEFTAMLLAVLMIICILENKSICKFLSCKIFTYLGKLSFPIYLLHMPIILFFSCRLMLYLLNHFSYTQTYLITEISTILIVLVMSKIWNLTIQKLCDLGMLKAMKCVDSHILKR
jgi:peptidoglycan/LPS O-acetylase OafA/YrhL